MLCTTGLANLFATPLHAARADSFETVDGRIMLRKCAAVVTVHDHDNHVPLSSVAKALWLTYARDALSVARVVRLFAANHTSDFRISDRNGRVFDAVDGFDFWDLKGEIPKVVPCASLTQAIALGRETIQRMYDIAIGSGYEPPAARRLAIFVADTICEGLDFIVGATADVVLKDEESGVVVSVKDCRIDKYYVDARDGQLVGTLFMDAVMEQLSHDEQRPKSTYAALLRMVGLSIGDLDQEYRHRLEHYIDCRRNDFPCRNMLEEDWGNYRDDIVQHARLFRRYDINTDLESFQNDLIRHDKIQPHHYGAWTEQHLEERKWLPKTNCSVYYAHGRQIKMPDATKMVKVRGKQLFCRIVNRKLMVAGKDIDTVVAAGHGAVKFTSGFRKFWSGQHVEPDPKLANNSSKADIVLNQALEGSGEPDDIDWFLGLIMYDVIDVQSSRTYVCPRGGNIKKVGHNVTVPLSAAFVESMQWLTDGDRILMRQSDGSFFELTGTANIWKCQTVGGEQVTESELRQCRVSVSRALY